MSPKSGMEQEQAKPDCCISILGTEIVVGTVAKVTVREINIGASKMKYAY